MSGWARIRDVDPDPVPEPVAPIHLPRPEDPFTVRSRRVASAVSTIVHALLILFVLVLPQLLPESLRLRPRARQVEQYEKVPITFREYRPAPPPPPQPTMRRGEATRGQLAPPRAPEPVPLPDRREAGAAGPKAPQGPDLGQLPPPGGSVLPPDTGTQTRPAPSSRPGNRPFDLNRALEDFRRKVPPADPKEGPRSGSGNAERGSGPGPGLAVPNTGFSSGSLRFESRDYDWTDYAQQVYQVMWKAWHSRLYQTTDHFERYAQQRGEWFLSDQVAVRFTIEKNGQVVGIAIEMPSDCGPLDESAVDTLREVVLPPLPADFPRDRETAHYLFIMRGDLRGLHPSLEYLHRQGYF